ncbi:MAG: DUF58 domain-containing protein [Candidatus Bathyarchaeota archaeon]|nr:MAG: DUF58 domain-containing protein [Candidatus Bathyarchaeota archaeon]
MTFVAKEAGFLLKGFTIIFFSGFLLANSILICASFIPLFVYLLGVFSTNPEVQIKKTDLPSSVRLGETVKVRITGKIASGLGATVIYDEVPEPFQLIEGNNYQIVSKRFKEKAFDFSYRIKCTKCGNYRLGTGWETKHVLGLYPTKASIKETAQLKVIPRLPRIRRMKLPMRTTQRVRPGEAIAKIGPLSTDFKQIRDYFSGDPFRIINWKASARAAGWGKLYPMVNEYEREGKLAIWLFLDANPALRIGTSVENVLEYSMKTAYSIAYYFLSKGYILGLYIYNHRGETFHFDVGKKQFMKIANSLLELTPRKAGLQVSWDEGFSKAVERNRKFVMMQSPGVIVITHITSSNSGDLLNGMKKILAYKRRKRKPNILTINILPYDILPKVNSWEIFAAKMLDVASKDFSNQLRDLGVTVLDWNPEEGNVETALSRTTWLR